MLYPGVYTYPNSGVSARAFKICDDYTVDLLANVLSRQALLIFSGLVFAIAPIYMIVVKREHEMIYAAILPFTDPTTDQGFLINFTHQVILLLVPVPAILGIELIVCMTKNSICVTAALIEESLQMLDANLRRDPKFTDERAWELRNLILKIQDFDR